MFSKKVPVFCCGRKRKGKKFSGIVSQNVIAKLENPKESEYLGWIQI
jgi:hypothetical protein